ncbi:TetR/AcrR family transcriptional regulator [Candidatus Solincola tengchongensis]|uniref:TetR/AcrR family transcriptional regulator n=1 Tax=Candidatus Solincola tengchongensis TaxID=2900693 RepID=UPI00257A505E|nr:TetR/AcrR family transcriptional regulator [Candidatus Solincola tengchongensis]
MARKRLPAEKRKESILKAAERCLARKGYYSCTTADIAAQAGITEPILYQHFEGKRDIVECMRRRTIQEISEYVTRRALKRTTPLAGLREAAEAAFDFTRRHRSKMRAYYYSIPELGRGGFRHTPVDRLHRLHDAVTYMLREGQMRGEVKKDLEVEDFAWSYIALLEIVYIANALGLKVPFSDKGKYLELVDRLLLSASATGEIRG